MGVFADLGVNQDCAQKNKVAKPGMNYVAVDSHLSKASGHLGGNDPHLLAPPTRLHGETGGASVA
jgi:hypothetical protein